MDGSSGIVPTLPVGGNGFGGNAGDWIFALIFLAVLGGNNGIFGNNGYNNLATTDYVSSEFTQRDIADVNTNMNNGFQNISNAIAAISARTNDNLCDLKASVLTGDMGLSNSILENRYAGQLNACQTQRDILTQTNELNTNLLEEER